MGEGQVEDGPHPAQRSQASHPTPPALGPLTPALPSPPRALGAGAQTERPQVASLASALADTSALSPFFYLCRTQHLLSLPFRGPRQRAPNLLGLSTKKRVVS